MALNIAVVGMGGIGNQHARIYRDHEACNVLAICDAMKDKADEAAKYMIAGRFIVLKNF